MNVILKSQDYVRETLFTLMFTKMRLLIAGGLEKFLIYQLKNGCLKFLGQVNQNDIIYCLCEIKCSNLILYGNFDGEIKFLHQAGLNHSKYLMKLTKHNSMIPSILINNEEDEIYSCSTKIIKTDRKQQYKYSETILQNNSNIKCMSLDETFNKRIICALEKQIIILQKDPLDQQWKQMQMIRIKRNGERLCFINGNQFVFQQYLKKTMLVFEFDNDKKQYQKSQEISVGMGISQCDFGFQMKYSKEKSFIINKNTQYVNIIKVKENNEFVMISQINFDTPAVYGSLSDDGKYLVTWDKKSKLIQLRELTDLGQ